MADKATQLKTMLAATVESLGLELLGIEYLPAPGGALVQWLGWPLASLFEKLNSQAAEQPSSWAAARAGPRKAP